MAQPYIGEIRLFAGNFEPTGWKFCNGQMLPISENETLFQLIGTIYGGDGESTFALPDLRGRAPLHFLSTTDIGTTGGAENVTLTVPQTPVHTHPPLATTAAGTSANAQGNVLATSQAVLLYRESSANQPLSPNAVAPAGGSQPHENMQPFLCLNFILSLFGLFPNQT
jgi:microcystin-dependent protein